jgi:hypothetical protein
MRMGTEPISSSGHPFPLTLRVNAEGRRKNAERGMAPVQPAVFILHFQLGAPIPPHPTLSPEEREKYPPRYDVKTRHKSEWVVKGDGMGCGG